MSFGDLSHRHARPAAVIDLSPIVLDLNRPSLCARITDPMVKRRNRSANPRACREPTPFRGRSRIPRNRCLRLQ